MINITRQVNVTDKKITSNFLTSWFPAWVKSRICKRSNLLKVKLFMAG